VIICYLYLKGVSFLPLKADAPLIVDPNAVLAASIAVKFLQPVSR
jgi:hypothetical protein